MHSIRSLEFSVEDSYLELAERKGLGHPDTIIDAIVEHVSMKLSREYIEHYGRILHHNVDKGLIVGGKSFVSFGGGVVEKPIEVYVGGRATSAVGAHTINVEGLAMETAREYLESRFPHLDVDEEVIIIPKIREGSSDLRDLLDRKTPVANDTSFGVGFAPYSTMERMILETEEYLNSPELKKAMPYVGEDVKVMGVREGDKYKLTIAVAFVSKYISDLHDYVDKKERLLELLSKRLSQSYSDEKISIYMNTADDYPRNSVYMTKTGLSMEGGDDGQVGRGNRTSGLITPYRMMSMEAAAGKNPANHVGKIYNVLANEICKDIVRQYDFVSSAELILQSRIGDPINYPSVIDLRVKLDKGYSLEAERHKLEYVLNSWLENVDEITEMIVYGRARIY